MLTHIEPKYEVMLIFSQQVQSMIIKAFILSGLDTGTQVGSKLSQTREKTTCRPAQMWWVGPKFVNASNGESCTGI
jgi:hypothetical protein